MRFRYFIIPFIVFLTTALSVWWFYMPANAMWILSILAVGYLWSAWRLEPERLDWWRLAISPWCLTASILLFCLLISGPIIFFSLITVSIFLQIIYWRHLLMYTNNVSEYIPFSLERLSFNYNFLTIFFLAASLFGFKTFLDTSMWVLGPIFGACILILISQRLWISQIKNQMAWRMAASIFLGVMEVFLIVPLLPLDFRLLAFLVAASYYGLVTLSVEQTEQELSKTNLRFFIIIFIIGCIAVFVTARWY